VVTGHLAAGGTKQVMINLDQVAVASFALFDPSHSLAVQVRGPSGKQIVLNAAEHGYVEIDDPATLVALGYGFDHPAPGPWQITLSTTQRTPPEGAAYAMRAKVVGGAELRAGVDQVLPRLHDTVTITGSLMLAREPVPDAHIAATFRTPDGHTHAVALVGSGAAARMRWTPTQAGIYGVEVTAHGHAPNGTAVERMTTLAFAVPPSPDVGMRTLLVLGHSLSAVVAYVGLRLAQRRQRDRWCTPRTHRHRIHVTRKPSRPRSWRM
jgi:hypothetical protein